MYFLKTNFDCDDKSFSFLNALNTFEEKKLRDSYVWVSSCVCNYFPLSRIDYAKCGVMAVVATIFDSLSALILVPLSVCTLGKISVLNMSAKNLLRSTGLLLSEPYRFFLKTLNPHAAFLENEVRDQLVFKRAELENPRLLSELVRDMLESHIESCMESEQALVLHVGSRVCIASLWISSIVARIIDFAIGLMACFASFVVSGKSLKLNRLAYHGLQITGILSDVYVNGMRVVNPHVQFVEEKVQWSLPAKKPKKGNSPSISSKMSEWISRIKSKSILRVPGLPTVNFARLRDRIPF